MLTVATLRERQIADYQGLFAHKVIEYSLPELFQKYLDRDYLFIERFPEATWSQRQQSQFIEAMMLGLPILPISVVPARGRQEIVTGSQSVIALTNFLDDRLRLWGLKYMTLLTGMTYIDLPIESRIKFNTYTLKAIEFTSPHLFANVP